MADKAALKKIREGNLEKILKVLSRGEEISRIDLAQECALSPGTITQLVGILLEKGIVEEYKTGDSSVGRKPVYIRINKDYGSTLIFEIRHSGVTADLYDLAHNELAHIDVSNQFITGDRLLEVISGVIVSIKRTRKDLPGIIYIGLLCQEDILDTDLMTLYSTSLSSDMVPIEVAISSAFGIPVKKEYVEKYCLDYYVQNCGIHCKNYAFINIGERITASFTKCGTGREAAGDTLYDITSLVFNDAEELSPAQEKDRPNSVTSVLDLAQKEYMLRHRNSVLSVSKLVNVIKSVTIFFSTDMVFIRDKYCQIQNKMNEISSGLNGNPPVRYVELADVNAQKMFLDKLTNDLIGIMTSI